MEMDQVSKDIDLQSAICSGKVLNFKYSDPNLYITDYLGIDWSNMFSFFYQRPLTDITSCHSVKCIIASPLSTHIIRISLLIL